MRHRYPVYPQEARGAVGIGSSPQTRLVGSPWGQGIFKPPIEDVFFWPYEDFEGGTVGQPIEGFAPTAGGWKYTDVTRAHWGGAAEHLGTEGLQSNIVRLGSGHLPYFFIPFSLRYHVFNVALGFECGLIFGYEDGLNFSVFEMHRAGAARTWEVWDLKGGVWSLKGTSALYTEADAWHRLSIIVTPTRHFWAVYRIGLTPTLLCEGDLAAPIGPLWGILYLGTAVGADQDTVWLDWVKQHPPFYIEY